MHLPKAATGINRKVLLLGAASLVLLSDAAFAQSQLDEQDYDVAARVASEFQPIGARAGGFYFYPYADVSVTGTNNVLATNTAKREDLVLDALAGVRMVMPTVQNRAVLQAYAGRNFHADNIGENRSRYGGRGFLRAGRLDGDHLTVELNARHDTVDRENLNNVPEADSPVRFNVFSALANYTKRFNRIGLTVGGNVLRSDFQDARDRNGLVLDQDFRDFTEYGLSGEIAYDWRETMALIVRGSAERIEYDFGPSDAGFVIGTDRDRDSKRYRVEGGARFSMLDRLYGDITVGYAKRDYVAQPNPLRNTGGLSATANLVWLASPATSVRFRASRDYLESAARQLAGFRASGVELAVQHSPVYGVILEASGRYRYVEPVGNGFDRDEFSFAMKASKYFSSRYRLSAQYRLSGRDTGDLTSKYTGHYLGAALAVTY